MRLFKNKYFYIILLIILFIIHYFVFCKKEQFNLISSEEIEKLRQEAKKGLTCLESGSSDCFPEEEVEEEGTNLNEQFLKKYYHPYKNYVELTFGAEVEDFGDQSNKSSGSSNENAQSSVSGQSSDTTSSISSQGTNSSDNSSEIINTKIGTTQDGIDGSNINSNLNNNNSNNNNNNNNNNNKDNLELVPAPSPSYMKSMMGDEVKELIDKRGNNTGSEFLKKYKKKSRKDILAGTIFDRSKKNVNYLINMIRKHLIKINFVLYLIRLKIITIN